MITDNSYGRIKLIYVIMILFFTILTPDIKIKFLPAFRLEQVLLIFIFIVVMIKIAMGNKITIYSSSFIKIYIIFPVIILISTISGTIAGYKVTLNDYFEIYKVFLYIMTYLVVSSAITDNKSRNIILKNITIFVSISALIAISQYFNFLGLNEKYIPIIAPTQYRALMPGYSTPRVIGMSNNPNVYSVISGVGFITSLYLIIITKKVRYISTSILCFTANLMTLSRSGFIFMFVSGTVFFVSFISEKGLNFKNILSGKINTLVRNYLLIFLLIILISIFAFWLIIPEDLIWRLQRGIRIGEDSSWGIRLIRWNETFKLFSKSPLFGIGPGKNHLMHVDNEWLFLLTRYGIVGTLTLIAAFLSMIFDIDRLSIYRSIFYGIIIGMTLYMIPANIYHSFQLMILIMTILACLIKPKHIIELS